MNDTARLDPRPILAVLGVTDAGEIRPVQGGWDAAIWRVEHGGVVSALRVFAPGSDTVCRHELLAMRAAAPLAPEVRAEGRWQDRPALLIAWCAGRTLEAELLARPWQARRLGRLFGAEQARIHAIVAPGGLRERRPDWITLTLPEDLPIQERLRALPRREDVLLHLDYHPLNVMVDRGRVSGVLDWTNAAPGDPRADLARTLSIMRLMAGGPDGPRPHEVVLLRLFERGWRRGYAGVAGRADIPPLFNAWAGAMMLRDLTPKVGQPGNWLEPRHLDTIRRWRDRWSTGAER